MGNKRGILAVVAALVIIGVNVLPAFADEPPPPILGEPLTGRAVFVDDIGMKIKIAHDGSETTVVNSREPSHTVVVRYTVQPGAQFPVAHASRSRRRERRLRGADVYRRRGLPRAYVHGGGGIRRCRARSRPLRDQPDERPDHPHRDLLRGPGEWPAPHPRRAGRLLTRAGESAKAGIRSDAMRS